MDDTDFLALCFMERHGGGFASKLVAAWLHADHEFSPPRVPPSRLNRRREAGTEGVRVTARVPGDCMGWLESEADFAREAMITDYADIRGE